MQSPIISGYDRVSRVDSFQQLVATPFAGGVNALCWPRTLPGDFGEIVVLLGKSEEPIVTLDEARLCRLKTSAAGRTAIDVMLGDLRLLRDLGRDPVLNCIHGYPRDEEPAPVATDVFSFHVDSAPVEADTWLCTYHGPASEGLRNDEAMRKVDDPTIRAELLKLHGGADDADFHGWLTENCYDLHYAPLPHAQPFSFGRFNFWRIACEHTGSPRHSSNEQRRVPPCVHRAPVTEPGQPRLLLIA